MGKIHWERLKGFRIAEPGTQPPRSEVPPTVHPEERKVLRKLHAIEKRATLPLNGRIISSQEVEVIGPIALPPEIWVLILSYVVSPKSMCAMAATCKLLHILTHDELVWRPMLQRIQYVRKVIEEEINFASISGPKRAANLLSSQLGI